MWHCVICNCFNIQGIPGLIMLCIYHAGYRLPVHTGGKLLWLVICHSQKRLTNHKIMKYCSKKHQYAVTFSSEYSRIQKCTKWTTDSQTQLRLHDLWLWQQPAYSSKVQQPQCPLETLLLWFWFLHMFVLLDVVWMCVFSVWFVSTIKLWNEKANIILISNEVKLEY